MAGLNNFLMKNNFMKNLINSKIVIYAKLELLK